MVAGLERGGCGLLAAGWLICASLVACGGGEGGVLPVPELVQANPGGDACAPVQPVAGIFASYRKDFYLPNATYSEPTEPPLDGGRIQIAGIAERDGEVTRVLIDGRDVEQLVSELRMEWYHVWPRVVRAGEPVWVAFHSRDPAWDRADQARIEILSGPDPVLAGDFEVRISEVPIGYVTTSEAMDRIIIHVQNQSEREHTLTSLLVNGREVYTTDVAAVASATIPASGSAMWTTAACTPVEPGAAWTVVARFEQTAPAVGVGRILKPHFPVEAWPSSSECPLPGVNDEAFGLLHGGGIDTFYTYYNGWASCGYDQMEMFTRTLPARGDTFLLLGDDFPYEDPAPEKMRDTSAILGFLTGDESDWDIYTDEPYPKAALKARRSRILWDLYPELATYNGAMTNKHIGTFAGMADIQGIDIYAAACAPHILAFGDAPPLRAPYDYLLNARNNHMPLPTWLYAQGLGEWAGQPEPQEILTQALMVAAAGGKGLMWFQAKKSLADAAPATWDAMVQANRIFHGIRRHLRAGDITGAARSDPDTIVEMVRAPDALVVPVINVACLEAPSDSQCVQARLGAAEVPHFVLEPRDVDVAVRIPDDVRVEEVFEVTAGGPQDIGCTLKRDGRTLRIERIPLDNHTPVRVFVLAADPTVRQETARAMDAGRQ